VLKEPRILVFLPPRKAWLFPAVALALVVGAASCGPLKDRANPTDPSATSTDTTVSRPGSRFVGTYRCYDSAGQRPENDSVYWSGTTLVFRTYNTAYQIEALYYPEVLSETSVRFTGSLTATLSADGNRIDFNNGTWWIRE
jgi:hypothetical protein